MSAIHVQFQCELSLHHRNYGLNYYGEEDDWSQAWGQDHYNYNTYDYDCDYYDQGYIGNVIMLLEKDEDMEQITKTKSQISE